MSNQGPSSPREFAKKLEEMASKYRNAPVSPTAEDGHLLHPRVPFELGTGERIAELLFGFMQAIFPVTQSAEESLEVKHKLHLLLLIKVLKIQFPSLRGACDEAIH